jgi:hypothetical protein
MVLSFSSQLHNMKRQANNSCSEFKKYKNPLQRTNQIAKGQQYVSMVRSVKNIAD